LADLTPALHTEPSTPMAQISQGRLIANVAANAVVMIDQHEGHPDG
jgi:hypothetical protein